ncbi:unnamed protein product [Zymoseptoria tritici ST99CH_3D7]|uniref:Cytokinesis regulator n=1 Tax=Zymoseptoria tritici (strain ST99CH_3D7) TaxID=1276538 RepID=A0A1X7RIZ8_ZYMT9|nr:unnamed protein product [Zymoseptoria tritici ST99CH_3D7]
MAAASGDMESWDDDVDFQGDFQAFAGQSTGTAHSMSSRLSVHSESVAGDEDWNVVIQPDNEQSIDQAILSAKQAGIPLPANVPTSALLGGTIKRLGKKTSKQRVGDDWDQDLEMSDVPLKLKPRLEDAAVFTGEEMDDFDDLEGSLGIRFAGTRRDVRDRSESASMISPSLGSVTAESEADDLGGLELPDGPIDLDALLKKRRATEAELSDLSQPNSAIIEQKATMDNHNIHKKSKLVPDESDDFLDDFDLASGDILDVRKRTNKNVQVKSTRPMHAPHRSATTINFHDKPTDKPVHVFNRSHIPRPVSGTKQTTRLEPVFESGAPQAVRERRQPAASNASSQLLRTKRSMPVLRHKPSAGTFVKPPAPFAPSGASNYAAQQRAMPYHMRRDSDPHSRHGAHSPPPRPHSRLSNQVAPDTPSRQSRNRENMAPASLAREAASKRTLTKPAKKRNFGDGSELEIFDDLPTSSTKESKFVKQPIARGPPKQSIRRTQSRSEFRFPARPLTTVSDRMVTPAPQTPSSPGKGFQDIQQSTPSYLRDTAASRIARESRIGHNPRARSEGPLQPLTTNWKAQVAARSPFSSPSAQRQKSTKRPGLISGIGSHIPKCEKGMIYNPQTLRWEGNENTLSQFDLPPPETPTPTSHERATSYMDAGHGLSSSPSRPALIAHVPTSSGHNVQVQNGMVYDPQQMKWLKFKGGRDVSGQLSPTPTDDEEDAFAGIDDLRDENTPVAMVSGSGEFLASPGSGNAPGVGEVHEEFDLGPRFIKLQELEEVAWRKKCDAWFVNGNPRPDDGAWRYAIREILSGDGMDGF